ncbi:MAG: hypothetical protein PWR10_221 [Halanaerobiales bacterium]|nr:hypothetical protein [Halanaerobiales bacterium]
MFIVLLFLFSLFFFPYLLIPFSLFFLLLIVLLPFKFTFDSIFHLITVPSQIYRIATNPVLRKNHGLEHATVNILEREYGYRNLAGYAEESGFYIIGATNIWAVEEAARKGLALMRKGYGDLAVHKRCGTSMTVANFVSAVIFLLLLLYTGHFSIFNMIIAIVAANLMGPLLGQVIQRRFTTTADVDEMEIVSARFADSNFWNHAVKIFVKTNRVPYVE